jgi:alpha-galactosidase
MQVLADIPIAELCAQAGAVFAEEKGAAGVSAGDFADPRSRFVLVNGWQSWSFAGELARNERPRRAVLKRGLNLFVDHPAEDEIRRLAGPGIVSHFYLALRAGSARLAMVSHNVENGRGGRPLPPVTFFIGVSGIRVAAYAEGGSFKAGETIARIAIVGGADYFALKDRLGLVFGAEERFEKHYFLGADETGREPIGGFETWYNHYLDIDEGIVGRDLDALGANDNLVNLMFLKKGKPVVFQIDDGWEECVGDWIPHEKKFPNGVAVLAARIEEKGLIPGIWAAPFLAMPESSLAKNHPEWLLRDDSGRPVSAGWNPGWGGDVFCLDLSLPEVEEYLAGLFDVIVNEWGFRYLKLDFLYAGMLRGTYAGRHETNAAGAGGGAEASGGRWEHYVRVLNRITSTKARNGKPVAWLACGAPIESTAPIMPLMRIGADTREHWEWPLLKLIGHQGRPSAKVNIGHTLARSLLDGTLLLNDPDVIFCRTQKTTLADNEKFLIGLVAFMFASQILVSDDPADFGTAAAGAAAKIAASRGAAPAHTPAGRGLSEP